MLVGLFYMSVCDMNVFLLVPLSTLLLVDSVGRIKYTLVIV